MEDNKNVNGNETDNGNMECDYKSGTMEPCMPLAVPYVPMQQFSMPQYPKDKALSRGTLFPGLDLPLGNVIVKTRSIDTPLEEVMAIDFVAHELHLYLDTHKDDSEAFETYRSFLKLSQEAHKRYTELYGPITTGDMIDSKHFTWLKNPWPWEYTEGNN